MNRFITALLFLFFSLSGTAVAEEVVRDFPQASLPSLISAIRVQQPVDFCGEQVPLSSPEAREKLEKELLLILWNRPQVILWLKRATRYFPYIERVLSMNSMPEDLKYIAVVESALLPHAGSSKGAVGYWQFIKSTGRRYGLTIDRNFDERRNFHASTKAALTYLKDLHGLFDSWTLAAAAYNVGEERIQDEMASQKVQNYYDFYLPLETQRYIFKMIAVKLIFADPARYGFHLQTEDYYGPTTFDRVKLTLLNKMPLSLIAEASGTNFKEIKKLNPEIRGHFLPKGTRIVAIPDGTGKNFHSRFSILAKKWRQENKMYVYTVKKGDNLSYIAEQHHVTLAALMAWNGLSPTSYIHPGEKLVIYQ